MQPISIKSISSIISNKNRQSFIRNRIITSELKFKDTDQMMTLKVPSQENQTAAPSSNI